jgi:hypothetical protein
MSKSTVPGGIEAVIRKAQNDTSFRTQLLKDRAKAAAAAGIELQPAEARILNAVSVETLGAVIEAASRRSLENAGPANVFKCVWGIRPDPLPEKMMLSRGIRPDLPIIGGSHSLIWRLLRVILLGLLVLGLIWVAVRCLR